MSSTEVSWILIATIQYLYLLTCISSLNKVHIRVPRVTYFILDDRTTSIQDSPVLQCDNNYITCNIILYKQSFLL